MSQNAILFEAAKKVIPGGVNSPVRAFGSVGGIPKFIKRAKGPFIWDANDDRFIDYIGSWGPAILGHAHPEVVQAVQKTAESGLSFGAPTENEVKISELIIKLMPSIEQIRLVNSGTEATMSAIRLARGHTKRDKIIKFEGCYHGHSDSLLVKAGSGMLTFGTPSSLGVPEDFTKHTIVLPYNDVEALENAFSKDGKDIACVIVEPFAGNMNLVRPSEEFIKTLRSVTEKNGSVLIYDEVMTGFRVALGGAQSLHGVVPDLTTMGKVIGGGMPMAAFGGKREIMASISPLGGVYQAGTLSGNPLATAAGIKTLELIQEKGFYEELERKTARLVNGLVAQAQKAGVAFNADHVGGMFGIYFMADKPHNYQDMQANDVATFNKFFHGMLERGVMLAPSSFEAGFMSQAHSDDIIDATIAKAGEVFETLKG